MIIPTFYLVERVGIAPTFRSPCFLRVFFTLTPHYVYFSHGQAVAHSSPAQRHFNTPDLVLISAESGKKCQISILLVLFNVSDPSHMLC